MPLIKTLKQHTIILDTHVFLWYMQGNTTLTPAFRKTVEKKEDGTVLVSAISMWEIGMLAERGRIQLEMDTLEWVEKALACPLIQIAPITPKIAIQSCRLPGTIHGDPAYRLLIATAFEHNAVLITRDEKILNYGKGRTCSVHNPT